MEEALFIGGSEDLKYWDPKYERIYFGEEFCERLIPSERGLKDVLEFCRDKKTGFTLVTPFVTDPGLGRLKTLFGLLDEEKKDAEIVVNDWGVMNFLGGNFPAFSLSLGRLLNKQKRGPRIMNVISELPGGALEYFRLPLGEAVFRTELREKFNLRRIELDNLLQGIERESSDIPASLYYPFMYISTTRYCLPALAIHEGGFKRKTSFKCGRECRDCIFTLASPEMPVRIYLKGNTQFVKNEKLPDDLESLNIDRLVYDGVGMKKENS